MRNDSVRIRGALLGLALLLAAGAVTAASVQAQQPAPAPPALEPKAIELLKASSSRLAAARSMTFTAVVSYESPSRLGPPLLYTTRSKVACSGPTSYGCSRSATGPRPSSITTARG